MKHIATVLLLTLLVSGCASSRQPAGVLHRRSQAQRLTAAVQLLEKGDTREATNMLAAICAEPPTPGVTDEALFRLALLQLGSETEKDGPHSAHQAVDRLQREYPTSPWSKQAAPLLELLASTSDLQRTNRNLKALNLALSQQNEGLTRESNELRERLERLKHLDLELEDKSR
jgi:outer membrane protein assembly factor BamD (BamD/ComL family)